MILATIMVLHSSLIQQSLFCCHHVHLITQYFLISSEAGSAYSRSASLNMRLGNKLETASQYVDAANCFKKVDRNGELQITPLFKLAFVLTFSDVHQSLNQGSLYLDISFFVNSNDGFYCG